MESTKNNKEQPRYILIELKYIAYYQHQEPDALAYWILRYNPDTHEAIIIHSHNDIPNAAIGNYATGPMPAPRGLINEIQSSICFSHLLKSSFENVLSAVERMAKEWSTRSYQDENEYTIKEVPKTKVFELML